MDRDDIWRVIESECGAAGIAPNTVAVETRNTDWVLVLSFESRWFEVGSLRSEGFFCRETTRGAEKDFVAAGCRPIFGAPDRLVREGLAAVRYALAHPRFSGVTYPVMID